MIVPQKKNADQFSQGPTLEELAVDPSKALVLDAHSAQVLTTTALAALNTLNSRQLSLAAVQGNSSNSIAYDRLMNVKEAGEKLGVKPDWLYRRHRRLSFTVRQGRMIRFSELGIDEYIRAHRKR